MSHASIPNFSPEFDLKVRKYSSDLYIFHRYIADKQISMARAEPKIDAKQEIIIVVVFVVVDVIEFDTNESSTTQSQNNVSNNQIGTTTNWNVPFGYSYLDYQCLLLPPNLHGISPQVVPHYVNHMSYFGLRPQLSIVQEDSREQEAEMESTGSLENESDRRSCDQIHATYSANDHRPSVSDLNLDSNFEMILMSPSTPPPPYSDKNIIAFV